ncbi:hypothetical protein C5S35_02910, partial [Candidatus Methanophagaceae archaeon]
DNYGDGDGYKQLDLISFGDAVDEKE